MMVLGAQSLLAQDVDLNQPAPLDKQVRFGILPNGMKYYIRANKLPEKRAEFYIVHNVGAILENDDQNGLAHFTEHMAFNGTTNFPKKALLNYLETIGCKFGQNVNAFTSMDVTCYNVSSVPVTREGIIDSCLLVLHDWSNYIAFDKDEIESERGVIREEWRTRGGAQSRLRDKLNPIVFAGSKYGKRNVIGDTAVINHFKPETITAFYHKWYRPDLQAVIVVGDINVDQMEAKVKSVFSTIPSVPNADSKPSFDVPENEKPLVGIATDPEATNYGLTVYFKHKPVADADKNLKYMRTDILHALITQMLNVRFADLLQKENAPCTRASAGYGNLVPSVDVFMLSSSPKTNQVLPSLELILTESRRMQLHGFVQSELDRAKANYLRSVQSQFLERDKQEHDRYVWDYFEHFTSNEPACDIEYYQSFVQQQMPGVTLAEINQAAKQYMTEKNVIITLTAPEKHDVQLPDTTQLVNVYNKITASNQSAYEDKLASTSLIDQLPQKGSVVKEAKNKKLDAVEWTLSNGIRVVLKTTNFKEDEVIMKGVSDGGNSLVVDDEYLTSMLLSPIVGEMGLGNFSKSDLRKVMSGKRASTNIGLGDEKESVSGNASPNDIELMLQQVYLRFMQPRFDEEAYNAYMALIRSALENKALNPAAAFSDSVQVILSGHNPRLKPVDVNRLSEMSFEKVKKVYAERFSDPASFTFLFLGNISADKLKPLVEKYLAALPAKNINEKYFDRGIRVPEGIVRSHFDKEMKTPKTSVFAYYSGSISYKLDEFVSLMAMKNILDLRYTESIREKEGGSYGVRVSAGYEKVPLKKAYLLMTFDTDPAKADKMVGILHEEVKNILENGPKSEDVQKAKEFFIKDFADQQKQNNFWFNVLYNHYIDHIDKTTDYIKLVNELNPEKIKAFANKTFAKKNIVEIVMIPAKENK
jgi:zinc protease